VEYVACLIANGRKVLLTHDGYRIHLSFKELETLRAGGLMAYALSAHASGVTQPLKAGVWGPLKTQLRSELDILRPFALEKTFD